MQTLKTISDAQKLSAKKLGVMEMHFLPYDIRRIYYNTDPLTFYAIYGGVKNGLLWACSGALEITEFIPESDFVEMVREAFDFDEDESL